MRLLLVLSDANGAVVTRDVIAQNCWAGRFVADDTINNTVAELRRALRKASGSTISVQTVPKTGYRLLTIDSDSSEPEERALVTSQTGARQLSRRVLLGGGLVVAAALGANGWRYLRFPNREAKLLIEDGAQALRAGLPESGPQAVRSIKQALQLDPNSAKAWGMLAIAQRATSEYGDPAVAERSIADAEASARRALTIDPRQSDALAALAMLIPAFGRWTEAEQRLRQVLKIDPANPFAVGALATLLMSTGQVRACLERLQWLHLNTPPSPNVQFRRVYTLWSAGQTAEMDRVADVALQAWPRHGGVWFARMWTLAFTGRVPAALAMLQDPVARPAMLLSALGDSKSALEVARAFLARQGSLVVRSRHSPLQPSLPDQHHRMAMMLWIPATDALRMDPGFHDLCDSIGLVRYWRDTGRRPDFRGGSIDYR
jgi:Tfp pilus assembly protein PilF